MAKLIPSGVVNLPNFAELQYNLNERERQKQLQFDEWSSQFDKKAGTYLDGDKEAVQTAYSGVESALKELARDPDNVDLRRKVREANASYNEVAGTAQFLADNYRQQWSAYNTEPDKFGVSGQEAIDLFNRERSTKRDANQIMSLASNPFALNPKYKYDMQSPNQIADEMVANFERNKNDYIKRDGTIDQDKAEKWATEYLLARNIDPEQLKNAVVFEGVSQGKIGRNGQINSRSELDVIETEGFAPLKEGLVTDYNNKAISAFLAKIPERGVSAYDQALANQKLSLEYAKLGDKQRKSKYFGIDPAPYVQKVGDKNIASGFMVPIDFAPVKSKGGQIVKFGKINGEPYVIENVKVERIDGEGNKFDTFQEKGRRATSSDLSLLRSATDGLSDTYFKALPSSQVQQRSAAQASASGQFDVTGAIEALGLNEERTPQDGEVWSTEMFGESRFASPEQSFEQEKERYLSRNTTESAEQYFNRIRTAAEEKKAREMAAIRAPFSDLIVD
jgi:hypothetical protein